MIATTTRYMTYSEWLSQQTPERQQAALEHMAVSRRLGEVQRTAPSSEEAKELTQKVRDHYEIWKDVP